MSLSSGARLGPYEVVAPIGAGGMGAVYRARDTKLNRDVALKVLLPEVANDPERLARFRREAQTLAALNHPHIGAIYGLEEGAPTSGGGHASTIALVLELVEGPTLADRIARGPIPVDDALPIARQIAEALEAAHEQGIIHRDLKPANIKVKDDGTVKVLDFGLAKALDPAAASSATAMNSPTITSPAMTQAGMILGTAAYMSPEQARGKPLDRRTDVWAFGCVLYEMLTGTRAFPGDDVTDTIVAIVSREPRWDALPDRAPGVHFVLRRCLDKDPARRFRAIGDAWLDLDGGRDADGLHLSARSPRGGAMGRRELTAWVLASVFLLAGVAVWRTASSPPVSDAPVVRLPFPEPPGVPISAVQFAMAPDGRHVAFVGLDAERTLWVRDLSASSSRSLAGTGDADFPFWSPDSREIGFFSGGHVKRVGLDGAPPVTLDTDGDPGGRMTGGTWNRDGVILVGSTQGVRRISRNGGTLEPVTSLDASSERAHWHPQFLPDGRHFVYVSVGREQHGAVLAALDEPTRTRLFATDSRVEWSASGHLLFVKDGVLTARAFNGRDAERLGSPVTLTEDVGTNPDNLGMGLSVSDAGTLVTRARGEGTVRGAAWFGRHARLPDPVATGDVSGIQALSLSPDRRWVAVMASPGGGAGRIWRLDAQGRPPVPLIDYALGTTDGPPRGVRLLWARDSTRLIFSSQGDLYALPADGSKATPELLLRTPGPGTEPLTLSPDGRVLLFSEQGADTGRDIWMRADGHAPAPWLATAFNEDRAEFSPSGNYVAYVSNPTGRDEVWIRPWPGPGSPVRVSQGGGTNPRWAPGGRALYFASAGAILRADVTTGGSLEVAVPEIFLDAREGGSRGEPSRLGGFDVADDGRILALANDTSSRGEITVAVNFFTELRRLVPSQ